MITNVNVSPLEYSNSNVVAMASVTIDNAVTVNSISIRTNSRSGELYVQMPQKYNKGKSAYEDIAFPITQDARDELNAKVIEKYRNPSADMDIRDEINYDAKISANIAKYDKPLENGKIGSGTVSVGDSFIVRNISVYENNKGLYWQMPSYKALDGSFKSMVVPSSPDAFKSLDTVIKDEVNTQYSYRMVDAATFKKLRDSCPDLYKQCSGASEDKNVKIKFKESDKAQILETLSRLKNMSESSAATAAKTAIAAAKPMMKR